MRPFEASTNGQAGETESEGGCWFLDGAGRFWSSIFGREPTRFVGFIKTCCWVLAAFRLRKLFESQVRRSIVGCSPCLISSCPILSNPILSYLILSYPILSYLILSYLILSYLILSYLIWSYLTLSYLILSYLILSYLILSYLILSYLILSYLMSSYFICLMCLALIFIYCFFSFRSFYHPPYLNYLVLSISLFYPILSDLIQSNPIHSYPMLSNSI